MKYPENIKINDRLFQIKYETSLKRTSTVKLKRSEVLISLSRFAGIKQREEMIGKFLKWAENKLKKMTTSDFVLPEYKDGGRIVTHNKIYEIKIIVENRKNNLALLKGDYLIELRLKAKPDQKEIKYLAEKVMIKDQTPYLQEVIMELNSLYFREKYNLLRFKRTGGRFGSLSSNKNINISLRLLFAPRTIFRYVCAHELAHLKEFNHSKKFWAEVKNAVPDYKECEKWLKNNGFFLG